jgi:ABC-type transporter Mla maintaining outer membrane lipid asymmetry permease subunit MlaE
MVPVVCYIAGFVGIWAGWLPVSGIVPIKTVAGAHLSHRIYFDSVFGVLDHKLLWITYKKSLYFGIIIAIVACLEGFATRGGAKGVGITVTRAVVISMVCIFIADLLLTV